MMLHDDLCCMIIFDFDQTLVDTSTTEHLRQARRWKEVNRRLCGLSPYPEVTETLFDIHKSGQELAIVTNSPDMVPRHFVKRYSWPIEIILGYHQVPRARRKPDPAGLLLALEQSDCSSESKNFHVGDASEDTEASRRAGVIAIGAGWGCSDISQLRASDPDHLFMSVHELRSFFRQLS